MNVRLSRGAWSELLEAIHHSAHDDDTWKARVVEAWRALLPAASDAGLHVVAETREPEAVENAPSVVAYRTGFSVIARPTPGAAIVLYAFQSKRVTLSLYERRVLARVALHLENAHRLRLGQASSAASGDQWGAIVEGRVSLVPRQADGAITFLLLENSPSLCERRAFTEAEARVVSMAARGLSTKVIAYELGLPPSTVSQHMAEAAAKVGVMTRADLVRVAGLATGEPPRGLATAALSAAEQEVLELIQRGLSNDRIAAARSRSIRTVANQVASILRKTNEPSRRALIASRARDVT